MPAYYTHYTCGLLSYRALTPGHLKRCILEEKRAYSIGLAGPDIFFYSVLDAMSRKCHAGGMMHVTRTGEFLNNLYKEAMKLSEKEKKIGIAYFAGFLGHYALDTNCHPIVYAFQCDEESKQGTGEHFMFEAAMDAYIVKEYLNRDMNEMDAPFLTKLSYRQIKVISKIVTKAFEKTYPEEKLTIANMETVLFFYKVVSILIMDRTGLKEICMKPVEKLLFHTVFATPLFINRNQYGITKEQYMPFREGFEKGVDYFKSLLPKLDAAISSSSQEDVTKLFDAIGNKSYHGGELTD